MENQNEITKPEAAAELEASAVSGLVMRYFRSQIIPGNPGTMVYWTEQNGKQADILPENIPEGAAVVDVTYDFDRREVRKSGNTFVAA